MTKIIAVPDLLKAVHATGNDRDCAERVETDLLNLYPQFTANTPVGTGGTAITEAVVDSAETALFNAKVPSERRELPHCRLKRLMVCCARIPGSVNTKRQAMPGLRALIDGTLGKIKDFYVFRSQFVPKTGTGPTTTNNLAFAHSAIGLAIRRLPKPLLGTGAIAEYAELGNFGMRVVMSYQPNTLAQQFTVDILYGVGFPQSNFGVQVRS